MIGRRLIGLGLNCDFRALSFHGLDSKLTSVFWGISKVFDCLMF